MASAARVRARSLVVGGCLAITLSLGSTITTVAAEPSTDPSAEPVASAAPAGSAPPEEPSAAAWAAAQLADATAQADARDISAGSGRYVVVGASGFPPVATAWWSADGLSWAAAAVADAPAGSAMTHVTATEDGFVALGSALLADGAERNQVLAWQSTDGAEWSPMKVEKPARSDLQAAVAGLADGPAGQLALGSFIGQDIAGQRLWRSTDGQTWTQVALPADKQAIWETVVAVPDAYLLLGQAKGGKPAIRRSADGETWRKVKGAPRLFDVVTGEDGSVVGIGWKDLWQSADAKQWRKVWTRPDTWEVDGSNAFGWAGWSGSGFMVPGIDFSGCAPNSDECQTNPLLVSADGREWTQSAGPDGLPGADPATWLTGVATLDGSTVVLGQVLGEPVVWQVPDAAETEAASG